MNGKNMFSGSIVALVTPFCEDGSVDLKSFADLIQWHIKSGTNGLVLFGTTGESSCLTTKEKEELLCIALPYAKNKISIIVGITENCTAMAIEKCKFFAKYPINGFLIVTPFYNRPNPSGLYQHYEKIATSTVLPIILYNVPTRTGVDLQDKEIVELAKIDNIIGIKDATGDIKRLSSLKEKIANFIYLSGDDSTSYQFLREGGDGVISVIANVLPKEHASYCAYSQDQNFFSAYAIAKKLLRYNEALSCDVNPIPIKWAMFRRKLCQPFMRLPLTMLSEIKREVVDELFIEELCEV